jgi:hypothetical protein
MKIRYLVFPIALSTLSLILDGCRKARSMPIDEFNKRSDELYTVYLNGKRYEAKQSLVDTLQLIENAGLGPSGKATCLFGTYARLYALEKRTGNEDLAEEALVQARYWDLRDDELGGKIPEKAGARIKTVTGAKVLEFVDRWDKAHGDGKGPRYLSLPYEEDGKP